MRIENLNVNNKRGSFLSGTAKKYLFSCIFFKRTHCSLMMMNPISISSSGHNKTVIQREHG